MTFKSILFGQIENFISNNPPEEPAFFIDLNLDQIINTITAGKQDYDLKPFFHTSLMSIDAIYYRQDIFRDLEYPTLFEKINSFSQKMIVMRRYLAMIETLRNNHHKAGWFLETVAIYCDAVNALTSDLSKAEIKSHGLATFREYMTAYVGSDCFVSLLRETQTLKKVLSSVTYCVIIEPGKVKIRKCEGEADYSLDVEKTFEKFRHGSVKDYTVKLSTGSGMNHVEAAILDFVARLYPDIFSNLGHYYENNRDYLDETIVVFDREIQFYIAYLEYAEKIKQAGLSFCYPQITDNKKEIYNDEGFDLALSYKRAIEKASVVVNDFYMSGKERMFIVSGPNQGGKTTFARTFGQLHYLAGIGCPVPGRKARLFLYDALFTHFEKEENILNLRGKLQDDLIRLHDILKQATPNSIVILNELFTSTTLKDATLLSRKVINQLISLDVFCVWVTFIDELASLSETIVSLVSTVVPENPALRTYKIVRRLADGLAFAIAIADKYRLTYAQLKERLNHEGFSDVQRS
jgi:hypothetical protein